MNRVGLRPVPPSKNKPGSQGLALLEIKSNLQHLGDDKYRQEEEIILTGQIVNASDVLFALFG